MRPSLQFILILVIFAIACNKTEKVTPEKTSDYLSDSTPGLVVADTIIYEVNIVNPNPEDTWTQECLSGLDHKSLIDNIFTMIYDGTATAYNHETGEKMTPAQVEKMEKEDSFDRTKIGMVQFKEVWYINPAETEMTKKVLSMVLGMGVYSNLGEFKGNKAIMRIQLQ
jgi:hypothetical protein